jgi:hypothetical protein
MIIITFTITLCAVSVCRIIVPISMPYQCAYQCAVSVCQSVCRISVPISVSYQCAVSLCLSVCRISVPISVPISVEQCVRYGFRFLIVLLPNCGVELAYFTLFILMSGDILVFLSLVMLTYIAPANIGTTYAVFQVQFATQPELSDKLRICTMVAS